VDSGLELEGGNRIELFAGRTTVVVFATDYGRTKRAANVLARAIAEREDPRSSARRLRADANQPGDGAACRTFHGHGVRALLVHALDEEARAFYLRHGLEPARTDPLHLMILIKDIAASIETSRRRRRR